MALDPAEMAERVTAFWREAEVRYARHREHLGVRVTYLASRPSAETTGPECDFAVPFA
ncbi:MAG TPA: hypothetical protein VIZ43_09550 [Trebonia sp.]